MNGRHRGAHHDPVGAALTGLWALGHVVVLGLLSALIQHHVEAGAMDRTDSSESAPDTPPPT